MLSSVGEGDGKLEFAEMLNYCEPQKFNLCFGRRGSDSSIETKSGAVLLGRRVEASEERVGEGDADEEAASQSLTLQVNSSARNFAQLQR